MKYLDIEAASLRSAGLNLISVMRWDALPAEIRTKIDSSNLSHHPRSLILIGHGGKKLWSAIPEDQFKRTDPIDNFSTEQSRLFADKLLGRDRYQVLFPGPVTVPLQRLGRYAGWHHDSPLGIGINGQWGLWFAYRAVLITDIELPKTAHAEGPNPCHSCQTRPCTTSCPASAISVETGLDLNKCTTFRLQAASVCARNCLARLACPIAPEHRYSPRQMEYHYSKSLETLQRFYGKND